MGGAVLQGRKERLVLLRQWKGLPLSPRGPVDPASLRACLCLKRGWCVLPTSQAITARDRNVHLALHPHRKCPLQRGGAVLSWVEQRPCSCRRGGGGVGNKEGHPLLCYHQEGREA